jgi:hypothetical protein
MKKIDTKVARLVRGILAILLGLVLMGIQMPNAGHSVVHPSISPNAIFERSLHDSLMVCIRAAIPLICIFVGMLFRYALVEYLGWVLLVIFIALSF